jgi:hypothetical protein
MTKTDKIMKAYNFFIEREKENRGFSIQEIISATGWAESTVKGYLTKKWHHFLVTNGGGIYFCKGIIEFPFNSFVRIHEQKSEISPYLYKPTYGDIVDTLLEKSREAALLAVQIYNSPTLKFRVQGYIVNMIIAYTALFHAKFEKEGLTYWYTDELGQPKIIDNDKKYWELTECISHYYKGIVSAEEQNLKLFIKIRNKIEHRYYQNLDLSLFGYCQSLLTNFEELIKKEFGKSFSLGESISLALQLTSFENFFDKTTTNPLRKIQSENYDDIRQYINDFLAPLSPEIINSRDFCFRAFLIPKIGNNQNTSDIAIEWVKLDPDNNEDLSFQNKVYGFVKEKLIPVANQGMLLPSQVVKIIQQNGIQFNMQMHTKSWKLYHVRKKGKAPEGCNIKYCQYNEPHGDYLYTQKWVDFLIEKLRDSNEYQKIRKYRDEL